MQTVLDCRDRTAEYLSTLDSFRKQLALTACPPLPGPVSMPVRSKKSWTSSSPSYVMGADWNPSSSSSSSFSSSFDPAKEPLLSNSQNENGSDIVQLESPLAKQSRFTEAASFISKNIVLVTEKLEKLATLARQRSLFEDSTQEINKLTYVVKTDLETLEAEINQLESVVKTHRPQNNQAQQNSKAIVHNLKSQVATTTHSFMEVLSKRSQTLKEQNSRRKHFEYTSNTSNNFRSRKANHFESLLNASQQSKSSSLSSTHSHSKGNGDGDHDDDKEDDLEQQTQDQQMMHVDEIEQDQYLASRQAAVQQIESTIVEISQMYKRVLTLLAAHDETLIRIEVQSEDALNDVEHGYEQLLKYFSSISSTKWLVLKIFAVLICFLVLFIVFIA